MILTPQKSEAVLKRMCSNQSKREKKHTVLKRLAETPRAGGSCLLFGAYPARLPLVCSAVLVAPAGFRGIQSSGELHRDAVEMTVSVLVPLVPRLNKDPPSE